MLASLRYRTTSGGEAVAASSWNSGSSLLLVDANAALPGKASASICVIARSVSGWGSMITNGANKVVSTGGDRSVEYADFTC
jgi:hypothetical protein